VVSDRIIWHGLVGLVWSITCYQEVCSGWNDLTEGHQKLHGLVEHIVTTVLA